MSTELTAIKHACNINKAERKALSQGKIDIRVRTIYCLYFISSIASPASLSSVYRAYKRCGRSISLNDLSDKIRELVDKGYVTHNGWGKCAITPSGLNALSVFEKILRKERFDR